MSTDFRALCVELINHLQVRVSNEDREIPTVGYYSQSQQLLDRARAALAQPEPVGVTDEGSVPLSPRVVTDSQISSNLALWVRLAKSLDLLASAAAEHEVFSARLDDLAALAVWACDDRDYRDALEVQP